MPRSKADWDAWFARREAAPSYAKGTKKIKKVPEGVSGRRVYVIGEVRHADLKFQQAHITKYADYRRANPTPAEAQLRDILNDLNGGVLKGQFVREHVISGKWIVDFYFPKIRLAIEVDGSIHLTGVQKRKDSMKDSDAARFDITVLRVTNAEVGGDRSRLVAKLRQGWGAALRRENKVIGKHYRS